MDWIESHKAILWHRKTGRLMRALSISRIEAVGYLHAFWWWCTDNAPDGSLVGIDPEDLADGSLWEGEPRAFLDGLISAGWVDETAEGLSAHDWYEHCGKLIERRRQDADRKRNARLGVVHRTSNGRPADGARTLPYPTVPNPTVPNPTVPGGESRPPAREGAAVQTPEAAADAEADVQAQEEQAETTVVVPSAGAPAPVDVSGWENSRTRPAPKPNGKSPPALSDAAREELVLYEHLLSSASDILADRLSPAQIKVLKSWFDDWKGKGLTGEVIDYAERETAAHTSGESLEYFVRVMQRKIEHPGDERRATNGSKQNGAHRQDREKGKASAAGSKFPDREGFADLVAQRAPGPPRAQSP
jgi:hypothetical protein